MSKAHSPNFPSLHLRRNSFSNPSVALPTSQLIFQPFRCFTYVTVHSPTLLSLLLRCSSAHSPTFPSLHLRHNSFSNPSFASPTSQALHLIHLASRPLFTYYFLWPISSLTLLSFVALNIFSACKCCEDRVFLFAEDSIFSGEDIISLTITWDDELVEKSDKVRTAGWGWGRCCASGNRWIKGAMGEISNFYNFPPRMLVFGTHMPPAVTMHAAMFHWCLSHTFLLMIFCFWKEGPSFKTYLLAQTLSRLHDLGFFSTVS